VFITKGNGELEDAPDWINKPLGNRPPQKDAPPNAVAQDINQQNLNTWRLHKEDGHILEVAVKEGNQTGLEEEAAARQAEAAKKAAEMDEVEFKTPEELDAMNKNELLDYIKEHHGVQLPASTPKAEVISAITDAQSAATAKAEDPKPPAPPAPAVPSQVRGLRR